MTVLTRRRLEEIIKDEVNSVVSASDVSDIKDLLVSIKNSIDSGVQELDLDLDMIFNAIIGSDATAWGTQFKQDIMGRAAVSSNKKR
jgi:chemotaxis protein CheY-P-specific phosphatase CheC